jgi:hypothetical protein
VTNADELAAALSSIAHSEEIVETEVSEFGTKYVIEGLLAAPRNATGVRTIWIIETGTELPRFVTAYPL